MPEPDAVPVADLQVADRIARAVRGGKAADRRPTIEQLVAAFGEAEPTIDARRRAARALALAGVAAVPDVLEAPPGGRVTLEVRRPRRRRALVLAVLALIALFAAAAAAATQIDFNNDDTADELPAGTSQSTATTEPAPTTTATTDTTTDTTTTQTTSTAAKPPPTSAERRRAKRARERRAAQRRARERRARARAAARRRVTVRMTATLPTFLCVEGDGRRLFDGTLSGSKTFRGKVLLFNIGLGPSTKVTANGKPVPLSGSPTGVRITPKGNAFLPLGSRPC